MLPIGVFILQEPMRQRGGSGFGIVWVALILLTADMFVHGTRQRAAAMGGDGRRRSPRIVLPPPRDRKCPRTRRCGRHRDRLLSGCASPAIVPSETPAPVAAIEPTGDGVLRVGTLFPSTGNFNFIGAAQVAGAALAVKELNDAGGVNGAPVELIQKDSADAGTATVEAAMTELINADVDVVIGPSSGTRWSSASRRSWWAAASR